MTRFILILLIAKIGFVANEAVTGLKLLEFGYHKEDLALGVLIDFPFQILFGYYAAKWSNGKNPLNPWLYGFYGRLTAAVFGLFLVYTISITGPTRPISFAGTVQFVSLGSFFTKISDPAIGLRGTYMTLLNTIANLGGTWPNFFVLKAVDYFTDATCHFENEGYSKSTKSRQPREVKSSTLPAKIDIDQSVEATMNKIASEVSKSQSSTILPIKFSSAPIQSRSEEIQNPFRCTDEHTKKLCASLSGSCIVAQDGYYLVSILSITLGVLTLLFIILPGVRFLENVPEQSWRLSKVKVDDNSEKKNEKGKKLFDLEVKGKELKTGKRKNEPKNK
ncbi:hypothetical protein HK096_010802 [Nowakowskiella sp. JEL0078]|nr:hypothetical protein HK096_010802 [Nowakowskiella sp. JEL0078]